GGGDHGRRQGLGVGPGIGRFEVDDVTQEHLSLVKLVAPNDDGLESQWALAQAGDHRLAAGLDALGDGDLALTRKQLHRAHLAQIHANRIVGAPRRLLGLGLGRDLLLDLDQLAALALGLLALLLALFARLLGLDHVDAHLAEHGEHVLDLLGIDLLGGQHRVDLVMGDVAALLGGADELLDRRVREVEQRAVRCALGCLLLRQVFLARRRFDIACHKPPRPALSQYRIAVLPRSRKGWLCLSKTSAAEEPINPMLIQSSGAQSTLWKYFRMSVWHDFIRRLEQDLAECRSDVELLESGRMQHRERRDGGTWVDTTQRELDWHKKTIGMYEGLVRKLRAEHGGGDL